MTIAYLGLALCILLAVLVWAVWHWGRARAGQDSTARALSHARQAQEIDETVARLDDRTLDQRLRDAGH
jgi:hypothetical protein